jgi:hypothetical protein
MGGERRSRQVICNGYKCPDLKLSAVPGECCVTHFFFESVRPWMYRLGKNDECLERVL